MHAKNVYTHTHAIDQFIGDTMSSGNRATPWGHDNIFDGANTFEIVVKNEKCQWTISLPHATYKFSNWNLIYSRKD